MKKLYLQSKLFYHHGLIIKHEILEEETSRGNEKYNSWTREVSATLQGLIKLSKPDFDDSNHWKFIYLGLHDLLSTDISPHRYSCPDLKVNNYDYVLQHYLANSNILDLGYSRFCSHVFQGHYVFNEVRFFTSSRTLKGLNSNARKHLSRCCQKYKRLSWQNDSFTRRHWKDTFVRLVKCYRIS